MQFTRRTDTEVWIRTGGCPFYFHQLPPRCAVTRMALGGRDVFEDDDERVSMASHDCGGDMHTCPYVTAMWDVDVPDVDVPDDMDDGDLLSVVIPDLGIKLDVCADPESFDADHDVVVIPTTRMGDWMNMGIDHGWDAETNTKVSQEIGMYERPFSMGDVAITKGWGSGHKMIIHVVIFDDVVGGGMSPEIIHLALIRALGIIDDLGDIRSVRYRPMCVPTPDGGTIPESWHVISATVSPIVSLRAAGRIPGCDHHRLDIIGDEMMVVARNMFSRAMASSAEDPGM